MVPYGNTSRPRHSKSTLPADGAALRLTRRSPRFLKGRRRGPCAADGGGRGAASSSSWSESWPKRFWPHSNSSNDVAVDLAPAQQVAETPRRAPVAHGEVAHGVADARLEPVRLEGHGAVHLPTGDVHAHAPVARRPGQEKSAKFPTFEAHISVVFHSFRLIFGRAIISPSALDALMFFSGTRACETLMLKRS